MVRCLSRTVALLFGLLPALVQAQGVLVVIDAERPVRLPRPVIIYPQPFPHPVQIAPPLESYKIAEIDINARLMDQVAQVQVSQSFVNTGSRLMEAQFVFPLPYEGAIEQMTLMVDGKELPAKLLRAEEARRIYEDIVRRNRDPALLEWIGTGMFRTSVFPIPPGAKRTVVLKYSQVCRKSEGLTDFLFPLSTAKYTSQAVDRVEIRATVESQQEIKNIYSPTHPVQIKRPDAKHATVIFSSKNEVPTADFRLLFDEGQAAVSTRVLSYRPSDGDDGYFLLLASPAIKPVAEKPARKTVMFVIDRSGSMSGKKIEQVRGALKFVLNNLHDGDLFNIVVFDNRIETFRPELQRFGAETRQAALSFVEDIYAGGSTDIDGALRTALGQLQDSKQPNYIVFLTDGMPTTGETSEPKIVANVLAENKVRARLFIFGVGYDVNGRLLDRLARDNFGQNEYVRPDENIEERISRLYHRIEAPVLTDVKIEFALDEKTTEAAKPVNRIYPHGSFDLFSGEQLVVVGRYKRPGAAKVALSGQVGGREQSFAFPAELVKKSGDESFGFIEKLWAVRRVGEILDEIDLHGKNDELVKELVDLSMRHGILTPYTSFLADEHTNIHDVTSNARRADDRLQVLNDTDGASGFEQRAFKGSLQAEGQAAPHSMSATPARAAGSNAASGFAGRINGNAATAGGIAPAASLNWSFAKEATAEAASADQNVRNVGNRAFYRREGQWVDSTLNQEQQSRAVHVKQFSDPYFELARRYGRQLSQYLLFDEPVSVNIEGQAYLIEP